ncbi:hypothetical protein E2C01_062698 [Portunus trituberculatus]|uniref:Uncharacterized protein n=1 Tax=Portunus trituberculatus TaxID=210409 RepID=A0A5B7HER9_PORTR|nr:hypothetical protein [Portunus trituberculatus]
METRPGTEGVNETCTQVTQVRQVTLTLSVLLKKSLVSCTETDHFLGRLCTPSSMRVLDTKEHTNPSLQETQQQEYH